jgi:hypothetical protein
VDGLRVWRDEMTPEAKAREIADEHESDCDKVKNYTDGIFWECFCRAVLLNTFAGARFIKR